MIKSSTILAKGIFALLLLGNAGGLIAQTQAGRNTNDISSQDKKRLARFEKDVDDFRNRLKIPGMSAVIVKDQKVVWAKGFGFADLENKIPATPDTLYHLASVTKTFASMLIMQLVEQGKLDLNEPMSHYSADFKDDSVKIKHIITHTSAGTPGERFQYDGNRYDYLTAVIEKKTGKKFGELVVQTFFDPLGMSNSVPYHHVAVDAEKWTASLGKEDLDRYKLSLANFAQPYAYYGNGEIIHTTYPYPDFVGAAAGLLSTVLDMAKYDIAIDRHVLIKKETQEQAWTPFVSNSGKRLPYGFGWFAMDHHGTRLIWHTGDWGSGFSAFYLKVPEKNLTLIMLANSEALVEHQYSIGEAMVDDAVRNVFVCSFLTTWDIGYGCDKDSQTAVAKFIEQRRASGKIAIQVSPKILESYVGKYKFESLNNRIFNVTSEGDKLFVQEPGGLRYLVFAESDTKFFLKDRSWSLVFTKPEGQPAQLSIVQGKDSYPSKRIE
ncbi:MAG TPA: serine hydrolase [Pyrinomonadaceae bacterium]|nr:serine hydrolase [Pyrinomonadaceae bacterium]